MSTPAARTAPPAVALPSRWDYDLWLDKDLDTAVVRLCFFDPVPTALVARTKARAFFSDVRDDASNELLTREGDRWVMKKGARCVRYQVDLAGAAAFSFRPDLAARVGDAVVFTPELAFLRPERCTYDARMTVAVTTWGERKVSTPWARNERGRYELPFNALWWRSYIAAGDLGLRDVSVPGGRLEVAFVDAQSFPDEDKYVAWLSASAGAVATLYGELPVDRMQVLVVPSPFPGRDPVMFGMVVRGGHPGAILLVRDDVPAKEFIGEWVLVHELSHLALPFIERDDLWMSEGFATWAQQVLRVRAHLINEQEGWDRFVRGLERARDGDVHRIPHVYWAGAGWWLLADLWLREHGSSAGAALADLRACCFEESRSLTPAAVVARISEKTPAFGEWVKHEAPSLADAPARALAALAELGVVSGEDGVQLNDGAPRAALRRAIVIGGAGGGGPAPASARTW